MKNTSYIEIWVLAGPVSFLYMGRQIEGLAIEFDKTEITGDFDKRKCDDVIEVRMNTREKIKIRIGCSEFRPHFQGVFK